MSRLPSAIVGMALSMTIAAFPASAKAQTSPAPAPLVRMKWQDFVSGPDGAARLQSFTRAVAKMKSLDNSPPTSVDFRRSWKYWANIHGFVGNGPRSRTLKQMIEIVTENAGPQYVAYLTGVGDQPGIKDQTPPDALASLVWATCVHSPSEDHPLNFFGWHRMYLYYFERVLRWAAQDPKLTLPYWDYTDPKQTALPVEFQQGDSSKPESPLYDWRRTTALNQGSVTLDPRQTNIDGPLTTSRNFLQYEGKIEGGIHGYIHCTVGQTCPVALMGLVPVAGNDPIFYEHHANIDRMWSCWSHLHPDEKPGDWQDQSFHFVDENGAEVTRKVKDFLDTKALGYVYDNESDCTRAAPARPVVAQVLPGAARAMISTVASKSLSLNPTSTSVDVSVAGKGAPSRAMAATAARSAVPSGTTLVLRDVTSATAPGALLAVYVAPKDAPNDRQYVATINWFAMQDDMPGMKGMGNRPRTFEYDIGPQLAELHLTDAAQVTVTLEASSGLVPAPQPPGSANLRAAAVAPPPSFRPEAKLSVGAIEIR